MTLRNHVSGRFGTNEVYDVLEKQRMDIFLRKEFALSIVESRRRRFRIQKRADSEEPRTDWASRPVGVTLVLTLGAQPLIEHELLVLSAFANIMMGLLLRDPSLVAVIKSVVLHSRIFGSSYETFFDEARIKVICEKLESLGFLQCVVGTVYGRLISVKRLVHRFSKGLELVQMVSDDAAAGDSAAWKGRLDITHPDNPWLLRSERKYALLSIEAVTFRTKIKTKRQKISRSV